MALRLDRHLPSGARGSDSRIAHRSGNSSVFLTAKRVGTTRLRRKNIARNCLHCLELWTSLLEVVAWDRARQPWPAEQDRTAVGSRSRQTAKTQAVFVRPHAWQVESISSMRNYRQEFSDFSPLVYLDCACQGPFPRVTVERLHQAIELKSHPDRLKAPEYFGLPQRVRARIARLTGADRRGNRASPTAPRKALASWRRAWTSARAMKSWWRARTFPPTSLLGFTCGGKA